MKAQANDGLISAIYIQTKTSTGSTQCRKQQISQQAKLKQRPVYQENSPLNSPFHHRCPQQACLSLCYFPADLIPATHQN